MREWLVIERSYKNSVFASDEDKKPLGYIPRVEAEELLGRDLGGTVWFTSHESDLMRAQPALAGHGATMKAIPAILLLLLLSACVPDEPTWESCWQGGKKVVPDQERERGWTCKRR